MGGQSYKIYINETKIILCHSKDIKKQPTDDSNLVARYSGKVKHLLGFIDMCEKSPRYNSITIYSENYDRLLKDFVDLYKTVEAGGGVVINDKNEILFIHRRGSWDLPKGKMESGETRRECAAREVKEETGIRGVQTDKKLLETRHTYKNSKGMRCIKLTHWYLMFAVSQDLTPQVEEDITKTKWMSLQKFYSKKREVYKNIVDVLNEVPTAKKGI